ncbi:MAG: hypothetical protein IPP07_08855 [Holophagales bacterium]|nr:hypothetical protein [Holophagales bacterium]
MARKVAWQGIRMLGEKAPPGLAEILVEGIAAEPTNWGDRMESIRMLRRVDRRIAAREAEAVLAIPFTISPPGAQYDAVAVLARIARDEKDPRRAIAALDRYLALIGFRTGRSRRTPGCACGESGSSIGNTGRQSTGCSASFAPRSPTRSLWRPKRTTSRLPGEA